MNCNSDYIKYKFEGVELSHVNLHKFQKMFEGKSNLPVRHLFVLLLAYDVKKLKLPSNNGFFSTFMEGWREDHYNLYKTVINKFSIRPAVNELYDLKKRFSFHPIICLKVGYSVLSKLKKHDISFVKKLHFVSEYVFLCNTILELDKLDFSNVDKYLCMCHVLGLENLLTQYLRKKGIATYSLQEGIYFIFRKNQVKGKIAYENFTTDHLLCWGQYTKDEYISYGIEPDRIDVAGYPKRCTEISLKAENSYRSCLVMLAGPLLGDVNHNLFLMLDSIKSNIEITLKPHPANYNEMKAYAHKHSFKIVEKSQSLASCFTSGKYDFSIAVNTTAYYESWMAGVPSIRYNDDRFDNFYGFDDFFSTKEELNSLLNRYRTSQKTDGEVREMLKYAIGFGIDNYDNIING